MGSGGLGGGFRRGARGAAAVFRLQPRDHGRALWNCAAAVFGRRRGLDGVRLRGERLFPRLSRRLPDAGPSPARLLRARRLGGRRSSLRTAGPGDAALAGGGSGAGAGGAVEIFRRLRAAGARRAFCRHAARAGLAERSASLGRGGARGAVSGAGGDLERRAWLGFAGVSVRPRGEGAGAQCEDIGASL